MKVKNAKLEWYVLRHDFNSDKIVEYNVFSEYFVNKLHIAIRKKEVANYAQLQRYIENYFLYYFWCKSEHEIMVGGLFTEKAKLTKIDIYTQLKMNLDRITDYVNTELRINFKKE